MVKILRLLDIVFRCNTAKKMCEILTSHCPVATKQCLLIPRFYSVNFCHDKCDSTPPDRWDNLTPDRFW